jgi:hypothetical protein
LDGGHGTPHDLLVLSDSSFRRLEIDMLASWLRFQRAYEAATEVDQVPSAQELADRRLADLERARRERDDAERALIERYRALMGR